MAYTLEHRFDKHLDVKSVTTWKKVPLGNILINVVFEIKVVDTSTSVNKNEHLALSVSNR